MNNAVWITWENQRRNKTLSKALSIDLYQLESDTHRILRYPILIFKTLMVLIKTRPKVIFAQNPSILLALFSVVYGLLFRKKIIIDAHNAGVYPFEGRFSWATRLSHFLFKKSYLTIVTNLTLKSYVESKGGKAFVLPDPFPEINNSKQMELKGKLNFLLICTWAADEPYEEVIKAFSGIDQNWVIYITGKSKGREKELSISLPSNVELTGYVSNADFDNFLQSCDCILDLTTREDCLVCGAYEAIAANKPLILSDTNALRDYFQNAAIYTKNNAEEIRSSVQSIAEDLPEATNRVKHYREQQQQSWNQMRDQLISILKLT